MRDLVNAFVALGANLGDARQTVLAAAQALGQSPDCQLVALSRLYRTAPLEAQGPDFVNAVAHIRTSQTAPRLLLTLQALEQSAGRQRLYLNAPRTLDLDILLYGAGQISSPALSIPHPRMMARAFVLHPLADVLPDFVQPQDLERVKTQAIEVMA
jgi:2-amino-4-hydroxy-6-hydroxymethyldihydropteridine diphosphokinase